MTTTTRRRVRIRDNGSSIVRTVDPLRDHVANSLKLALKQAVDGSHATAKAKVLP